MSALTSQEALNQTTLAQFHDLWMDINNIFNNTILHRFIRVIILLTKSYDILYNNKINARVLIGQSAMVYCAGKPMKKSRVFWIII